MKSTLFASALASALTATSFGQIVSELTSCHYFENEWSTSIESSTRSVTTLQFEDLNNFGFGYIAYEIEATAEAVVTYNFEEWAFGMDFQIYGVGEGCEFLPVAPEPWESEIEANPSNGSFLLPVGIYRVVFAEAVSGTVSIGVDSTLGAISVSELTSCHYFENEWSTSIESSTQNVSTLQFEDLENFGFGYIAYEIEATAEAVVTYNFEEWASGPDFQVYGVGEGCEFLPVAPEPWESEIEANPSNGSFLLPVGIYRVVFAEAVSGTVSIAQCLDSDGDGICVDQDLCPDDPNKTEPGNCGCGVPETDVFGDLDCDGDYDIDDARLAMTTFGIEEAEEDTCPADVDGDGSIGFSDVLIILNDWGACP